jgi:hypothetical protein
MLDHKSELYLEQYINIVSKDNPNPKDYETAKQCYDLAITILLNELDHNFQGWLTTDRESYWKSIKSQLCPK